MTYTTTSCPHCGFRTRNHEANVPSVQLGSPIIICPQCGQLIIDRINSEYEFMSDTKKAEFASSPALVKTYIGNILFISFGLFLLIAGMIVGNEYIFFGLIFGVGSIIYGITSIISAHKSANERIIEQAVYESLLRTSNNEYVEYIKKIYTECKIKKSFIPFKDKEEFLENNKEFLQRESFCENMKQFNCLLEMIDIEVPLKSLAVDVSTNEQENC